MSKNVEINSGLNFLSVLGLIFIVLKILGYISWSWWWVTAPIWGPAALVLIVLLFLGLIMGGLALYDRNSKR